MRNTRAPPLPQDNGDQLLLQTMHQQCEEQMTKWADYRGGDAKYLKADDLPEKAAVELAIEKVEVETLKNDDGEKDALVVYFSGKERGLVVNATNSRVLEDVFGTDVDAAIGQKVVLYRDMTNLRGKQVPCLRLRAPEQPVNSDEIPF